MSLERDGVPSRMTPIVLLLGRRGSGKTAVLDLLHERYQGVRPYVRINLSDDPDLDALRVLVAIKAGLSRKVPGVSPISFPRFELGLLVLGLDPNDSEAARRVQVDEILKGQGLARRINESQRDWAQRLGPLLGSHEQQLLMLIASDLLTWGLAHLGTRDRRRTATWFDENAKRATTPDSYPLANLCTWSAADIATTLCAGLLADLRLGFNKDGHWGRTTNCLVLLDDVESEAGSGFLAMLARCRQRGPAKEGPDPLVVVAGHGRRVEAPLTVGTSVDISSESLRYDGELPGEAKGAGAAESASWCRITLEDLSSEDVAKLVGSHVLGSQPRDTQFVYALTRGHPEATRRFAAALAASAAEAGGGDARVRELLDRELRDELISALLPRDVDEITLDALTVCAATPGMDHGACDSVFRYLGWRGDVITARRVRDFVRATLWGEQDVAGNLTPRPPLRLLLSRLLADQPERWREVHEQFAAHYRRVGNDDSARYHALALVTGLGEEAARFAVIAADLDAEFKQPNVAAWHAKLRRIAAAPNRLPAIADPRVTVTGLAGEPDESDRARVIARLLAALWLHDDWLFDPRRRLVQVVRDEYAHLGAKAGADGGEFYTASEHY